MNSIKKAIGILKKGGVVVYPTDTSYGLAVDATNPAAVKKLYRLKGRNFQKPIHVIVPLVKNLNTVKYLSKIVKLTPAAKKLIKKFWPGALTLVLPLKTRGKSWQILSAGTGTIGIRYPKHKIAQALVERFGKPITATSANLAGKPDCYSVAAVKKQFLKYIYAHIYVLDRGRLPKRKPSTVVSLVPLTPSPSPGGERGVLSSRKTKSSTVVSLIRHVKIIRRGPVPLSALRATLSQRERVDLKKNK